MNIPFTDSTGRINPIWHEYLRSFISNTVEVSGEEGASTVQTITAGNGLTSTVDGTELTLAVGAGSGMTVNANDINIDISSQTQVQAELDDELLISDRSDNNNIRKASVRDVVALGANPGGSNTYVQYNDNGVLNGDSGLTYDGAGTLTVSTNETVGSISIEGGTVDYIRFDGVTGSSNARIQSDGGGGYTLYSKYSGTNGASAHFSASGPPYLTFAFNTNDYMYMSSLTSGGNGCQLAGEMPLRRCFTNNITASTTQTQGNGLLTGDYNNVTTVANANDTVTLPAALSARYCLIRNSGANKLQIFPTSGDDLGAGTNTAITILPGETLSWFAIDATTWYPIDGLIKHSIQSGITASTTQTQGQQPLTKDVNEFSTVANANDATTLPTALAYSRTITIINNGANTLQIFPASGDNLGAGLNTSTTLAAGGKAQFINYDTTNWKQMI